jgi:cobyrinic acid a,c-diamide synthase
MVTLPRLVVAAPASGSGKTTVATGLMAAARARGLAVSPHKVGPDYIDPGYHALATGRPGRNLDPFLVGPQRIAGLFLHGATGADVGVVEGVMGLFDGRGASDESSTAEVARLLDAPVVLVVDAAAQSGSVAALVHGFTTFDPRVRIGAVVLNRVGSPRHEQILRDALAPLGLPVLGALPREPGVALPGRHLGLVPAAERGPLAVAAVAALGRLVERCCDVEALLALARTAPELSGPAWSPVDALGAAARGESDGGPGGPVVAVAGGAAFTFSYPETVELLTAAGARVAVVDPLRDESLPEGTRALVLGGGFPEMHAGELSANVALRRAVADLAATGAPVLAECAGLLYLTRSLDGAPMCGVLPATARMTPSLQLGYRDAVRFDGTPVRAHEFHRTSCEPDRGEQPAYTLAGGRREGFVTGGVQASYLHVHWAGTPALAGGLVAACR